MSFNYLKEFLPSKEKEDPLWELFHENSKLSKFSPGLSEDDIREQLEQFYESLPFPGLPFIPLTQRLPPIKVSLRQALLSRVSTRQMAKRPLSMQNLAALLRLSYGVNRNQPTSGIGRLLRTIPSAGALFPLEIFFYSNNIKGLLPGVYHYNPIQHNLRLFREGNQIEKISRSIVQNKIIFASSMLVFITAYFERSVLKYGDRGYRFSLIEAGHLAQNLNLTASGLGLGSLNIGGYFDREIDEFLGFDGITTSTVYMVAIGFSENNR